MAELPHLGKNCALSNCQLLDFTPFECRDCSQHFCSTHRFAHNCPNKNLNTLTEIPTGSAGAPLRPYLCSFNGCRSAESIKVVCPGCEVNFCLKHRLDVDHGCSSLEKQKKPVVPPALTAQIEKEIREKKEKEEKKTPVERKEKVLSAEEQKRADRVAVMKLKMKEKGGDLAHIFVITPSDGQRRPIGVAKNWSVGRCVDAALKTFNIPNENGVFGAENFRFFSESGEVLGEADGMLTKVADLGSVILRKDE
ncbi:hypothetical protein PMAYCL1PPCAC_02548 [Pristionchus mayeri]|uniref:AN1-type domain-containing protein n=1 Tax=Pristionchus mayeri TaxID=1317129 RepID=A0AAN4Z5K2_9BILA|nr:hypothetical protein PMAYCL1PPCAC_02548 [Pristionchus mayeri]